MLPDLIWDDFVIQMNETKKINETPFIQAVLWELLPEDVVEGMEEKSDRMWSYNVELPAD